MDSKKILEVCTILMIWSIENKDWKYVLSLYTIYNIGIPARFVYKLPKKIDNNFEETLFSRDPDLLELLSLFSKSKWKRLSEWKDSYGYSYH